MSSWSIWLNHFIFYCFRLSLLSLHDVLYPYISSFSMCIYFVQFIPCAFIHLPKYLFFLGEGGVMVEAQKHMYKLSSCATIFFFHQPFAILLINIFCGSRSFQPSLKFLHTWAGCIGGCDETLRQLIEICGTGSRIPGINACLPNYLTRSIYICKIELL